MCASPAREGSVRVLVALRGTSVWRTRCPQRQGTSGEATLALESGEAVPPLQFVPLPAAESHARAMRYQKVRLAHGGGGGARVACVCVCGAWRAPRPWCAACAGARTPFSPLPAARLVGCLGGDALQTACCGSYSSPAPLLLISRVCGVWCVVCGVWCVVCGVWCVWCVWCLCVYVCVCARVCGVCVWCVCGVCMRLCACVRVLPALPASACRRLRHCRPASCKWTRRTPSLRCSDDAYMPWQKRRPSWKTCPPLLMCVRAFGFVRVRS